MCSESVCLCPQSLCFWPESTAAVPAVEQLGREAALLGLAVAVHLDALEKYTPAVARLTAVSMPGTQSGDLGF